MLEVVFGGGSIGEGWGDGKAAAYRLAEEGALVSEVGISFDAAKQTPSMITVKGGDAISLASDVTRIEDGDRVMDVNLKSVFLASKFAVPLLESQKSDTIAEIPSLPDFGWLNYNYASKAAISNPTRSLPIPYAEKEIRANTIFPGRTHIPHIYEAMKDHLGDVEKMRRDGDAVTTMRRIGDACIFGNAAVFLASDEAKNIAGIDPCVDGGPHCKTH